MNEFKKEPLLTEIVHPHPAPAPNLESDLGALAEHLSVIADALRKSTGEAASATLSVAPPPYDQGTGAVTAAAGIVATDPRMHRQIYGEMAREAYAVRRRRNAIFKNDELFGEPAWDILLDLYIANVDNKSVSVSSACIGSAAPPTTGLRWLGVLSEQGLIAREHDPEDQRRVLVRLTDKGLAAMDQYFASLGLNP